MPSTRTVLSTLALLLLPASAFPKGKSKPTLPAYVLTARTVSVIIDPGAGQSLTDPRANEVAQSDVENALLRWGRFEPLIETSGADLIIVVSKGRGKLVDQTIPDHRQNGRPSAVDSIDDDISIGAQQGRPPSTSRTPSPEPPATSPSQTEIGSGEDTFTVYQGRVDHPMDRPPAWRLIAKDCLRSPSVPAVDEFKTAIAEAEKAAPKKP